MIRKTLLCIFAAAMAPVFMTSCITADVTAVLESDGSGTLDFSVAVTESMIEIAKEMRELDPGKDPLADSDSMAFKEPTEEEIKELAELGLEVLEVESVNTEDEVSSKAVVKFASVAALEHMGALSPEKGKEGAPFPMTLTVADDGVYTLTLVFDDSEGDDDREEDDWDEEDDEDPFAGGDPAAEPDPETAEKLMMLGMKVMGEAQNLRMNFGITVPGEVVDFTQATVGELDGSKVVWSIDAATIMQMQMAAAMSETEEESSGMEFAVRFRMPEGKNIPASALTPEEAVTTPDKDGQDDDK